MDFWLLQAFAFLRPIFFIDLGAEFGGLSLGELGAVGLAAMMIVAVSVNTTLRRSFAISTIDLWIIAFVVWCLALFTAYPQYGSPKILMQMILPPIGYIAAKNIIGTPERYRRVIGIMLVGYLLPVAASAILTALGKGLFVVNYWTGVARFAGVYSNPHNFGHNMTLFIILAVIWFQLRAIGGEAKRLRWRWLWIGAIALALYCLYFSYVRTAYIGLVTFLFIYLFFYHRRVWFGSLVAGAALAVLLAPLWSKIFFDVAKVDEGQWQEDQIASGRPAIWKHNWDEYLDLPIERRIVGAGVGNFGHHVGSHDDFIDSHSDLLQVLFETGVIGLALYLALQVQILIAVFRLPPETRYLFLALFVAVTLMNAASNSYISRFGLGQMLYVVLVWLELAPQRMPQQDTDEAVRPRPATVS